MFQNKIFDFNEINYLNYFIIKEDREHLGDEILAASRTSKIFSTKEGRCNYCAEMCNWLIDVLDLSDEVIFIPYPSTNARKPKDRQIPYIVTKLLSEKNQNIIDGSDILYRSVTLEKNTRDVEKQYASLSVRNGSRIESKRVIVFDDVTTTGSSLIAGLNKIREFQPKESYGLAIAKKVYLNEVPLSGIY